MKFDYAKKFEVIENHVVVKRRPYRHFIGRTSTKRQLNKESYDFAYKRNREIINREKNKPCMDCGVLYSPWIMQFDHRDPSEKTRDIRDLLCGSVKKLLAEIAKCDVVCGNCHLDRTYRNKHYLVRRPEVQVPEDPQLDLL